LPNAHLKFGLNQLCAVLLQQLKQLTILDASHLQDLSRPIAQVPVTQSLEEGLVNENCQGSTIGAHLVLSAVEIDSCLNSNRCINSCHDCSRDLDEWGVASVQVGSKTSYIQTDTTTNGNDGLLAPALTITAVSTTGKRQTDYAEQMNTPRPEHQT